MSDLAAMQPNLALKFHLAAPYERQNKFENEVARHAFVYDSLTRPLHEGVAFSRTPICSSISISTAMSFTGSTRLGWMASPLPTTPRRPIERVILPVTEGTQRRYRFNAVSPLSAHHRVQSADGAGTEDKLTCRLPVPQPSAGSVPWVCDSGGRPTLTG